MEREFVTARAAAAQLGVPESVIIDDVQEGMDGQLPALIGGRLAMRGSSTHGSYRASIWTGTGRGSLFIR